MRRTITVNPVTRIEGHATVHVDQADDGSIESARMVVNELRGFERILVGMQASAMPLMTARICGVCPSAHHLASAKALDNAAGVDPPPAAKMLRELMYMGHFIHSHALSLFVLQGPDLIVGIDADPAKRSIAWIVEAAPEVARKALTLRSLGQRINEDLGGRGVHPVTAVAGGVSQRLTEERRQALIAWVDQAMSLAVELAPFVEDALDQQLEKHPAFLRSLRLPSYYMGTVNNGKLNLYDGDLRVVDSEGKLVAEIPCTDYADYLEESALEWSYMKPVRLVDPQGEPHIYRVNTLARLNCADGFDTPRAQERLDALLERYGRPCHETILFSYARMIELIYACERASILLENDAILGEARIPVERLSGRGVGHVEAPRGTLIHDYEINDDGIIRSVNLLVATQQNYDAINETIRQAAEVLMGGDQDDELLINGIEFAIRCYDPCLSCSTHAVGQMPLEVVLTQHGRLVRRIRRDLP